MKLMNLIINLFIAAAFCATAHAFTEGTYSCKNSGEGLPNNIYKIQKISVSGGKAAEVPYVEVTRFSREKESDPQSAVLESHISGIATRISDSRGFDALQLMALTFEFENEQLLQCEK